MNRTLRSLLALACMALFLALGTPATAHADGGRQPLTGGVIGSSKRLGLGLQSGTISGLSVKYFLSPSTALQVGVGGSPWWGLGLNLEYLLHPFVLAQGSGFSIPLYFGAGIGFGRYYHYDYTGVNVHVPLGAALEFRPFPLDIFLQFEPGLGLGHDYIAFYGGFTGGARLYF